MTTEPKTTEAFKGTHAVGRRKEASARVRLLPGTTEMTVNGKPMVEYFNYKLHQNKIMEPLKMVGLADTFGISVKVEGGGVSGQAEAVRHGIARALVLLNEDYRKILRAVGFMTRDSRSKERKKFGLRKARRAPQWSKR